VNEVYGCGMSKVAEICPMLRSCLGEFKVPEVRSRLLRCASGLLEVAKVCRKCALGSYEVIEVALRCV
jgi:hypothetical protein